MTNNKLSDKTISRVENIINRLTSKSSILEDRENQRVKNYTIISLIAIIIVAILIFFYFKFYINK